MSKDFSDHHLDFGVRYDSVSRNGSITEKEEHDEHEGEEDHDEHEEEEHHDMFDRLEGAHGTMPRLEGNRRQGAERQCRHVSSRVPADTR